MKIIDILMNYMVGLVTKNPSELELGIVNVDCKPTNEHQ